LAFDNGPAGGELPELEHAPEIASNIDREGPAAVVETAGNIEAQHLEDGVRRKPEPGPGDAAVAGLDDAGSLGPHRVDDEELVQAAPERDAGRECRDGDQDERDC